MGGKSQRKGAQGERELAAVLRQYGYEIRRGGSLSFVEVPDLVGLPGVHIEVKRVERLNVPEAMHQATRDSERFRDGAPAVFHRRSREPWLVTMSLANFMDIYSAKFLNSPRKECEKNGTDAESAESDSGAIVQPIP